MPGSQGRASASDTTLAVPTGTMAIGTFGSARAWPATDLTHGAVAADRDDQIEPVRPPRPTDQRRASPWPLVTRTEHTSPRDSSDSRNCWPRRRPRA